jgi:hypothetical protein
MSQPGADRVDINAGAKKVAGAGVSNRMRANAFRRQRWHSDSDLHCIAPHHGVDAKPGEWTAAPIDEDVFSRSFLFD